MKYRAEIEGLRALAVIPVILFHAGFSLFGGGYVGVDVFFVISGYLITTIILGELEANSFRLITFYERRARRILPALIFVALCCLPFAWMWLAPFHMKDFAQSLVALAGFASNVLFWIETGYFDTSAELKPLLHTWSLGVEEQYYIAFPLLLMAAWRFGKKTLSATLAVLFAISLGLAVWGSVHAPYAAFFLLPTRVWELLLGAFCALYLATPRTRSAGLVQQLVSTLGLILIGVGVFGFDAATPTPSLYTLVPTSGAAMIILFAWDGTLVRRILSTSLLTRIGLISYSAYLWHQPLMAFARHRLLEPAPPVVMAALSLTSLGLGWLSWKFVESPFRGHSRISRNTVFTMGFTGLAAIGAFGLAGHFTGGFQGRATFPAVDQGWADASACTQALETQADIDAHLERMFADCFVAGKSVVMIGDSHAEAIAKAVRQRLEALGTHFIVLTNNACLPVPGTARNPEETGCTAFKTAVWEKVRRLNVPLVFAARWRLNFEGTRYDNRDGGVEDGIFGLNHVTGQTGGDLYEHVSRQLADIARNRTVVVVSQIPEAGWDVPTRMWKWDRFVSTAQPLSTRFDVYRESNAGVNAWLNNLQRSTDIRVVRAQDLVCDAATGRCLNELDGVPLYRDDDHPSFLYADMIARRIITRLGTAQNTDKR